MRNERIKQLKEFITELSKNSNCPKRKVGVAVTDMFFGTVGWNYNRTNFNTCHCADYSEFKGSRNNNCLAIHAEVAAIIDALKWSTSCLPESKHYALFTTHSPCINCAKIIVYSGIKEVYYIEEYCAESLKYLTDHNIKVEKILDF